MAKFEISDTFIRARIADAAEAGRHRVFYDSHKDSPTGFGVRVTKSGTASFVLTYYNAVGERRGTVGRWGRAPLLSVPAAREKAREMRQAVLAGSDPIAARAAARQNAIAARAAEQRRKQENTRKLDHSLGALLAAYVSHLRAAGKQSAGQVEAAIARHIGSRVSLAALPAEDVTVDDVMPVFQTLAKAGKQREAEKLRAYLRAAYTAAAQARTDAGMFAFAGFRIRVNPLAEFRVSRPKEAAEKAAAAAKERKFTLDVVQLAAYWARLQEAEHGNLLQFHLLTGGQRIEQLARLRAGEVDADSRTMTLRDTKGRRAVAAEHLVPLLPDAWKALEAMRGEAGSYLFTVTKGRTGAAYRTVWASIQTIAEAMVAAGEVGRVFTPGTIRKTVETRLQALGVDKEVRAHLLSHGRGGVQARHYEAHDFIDEKRTALRKLRRLLDPKGKVVMFPARVS